MNKLQKILTDITPTYEFRIKFASEPTKEDISKITARLIDRYDAFEVGPLVKTIFQDRPLDFYNLDCGEIWMFDFKCNRGIQPDILLYEIGNILKWSESLLRVRNMADPLEEEYEEENDIDFDEYDTVLGQDFGEGDKDSSDIAGQERSDAAVKDALNSMVTKNLYAEYMSAGYKAKE